MCDKCPAPLGGASHYIYPSPNLHSSVVPPKQNIPILPLASSLPSPLAWYPSFNRFDLCSYIRLRFVILFTIEPRKGVYANEAPIDSGLPYLWWDVDPRGPHDTLGPRVSFPSSHVLLRVDRRTAARTT